MENWSTSNGKRMGLAAINRLKLEWRRKAFPPPLPALLGSEARVRGAPIVTMTLEGPAQIFREGRLDILKYERSADQDARAFTFHTYKFDTLPTLGYLQRLRGGNKWEECNSEWYNTGFVLDNPNVSVKVGDNKSFVSLCQDEEWTATTMLREADDMLDFPEDTEVGDRFRFRYTGLELDWWDWGAKKDHAETNVLFSCTLHSAVLELKDNNGRPKLIVPASNTLEFTVIK